MDVNRRALLRGAAAALACLPRSISAGTLKVPTVSSLELTVVADNFANVFAADFERPDIAVSSPDPAPDYHRTYSAEWGYSLLARSLATPGASRKAVLIDFGYTPQALLNNLSLLSVAPETFDAMVLSHGHYDHFGGLDGLLATGAVHRCTLAARRRSALACAGPSLARRRSARSIVQRWRRLGSTSLSPLPPNSSPVRPLRRERSRM